MKAKSWEAKIRGQVRQAGMYRKEFGSVIATLASILEARDAAYEQWQEEGCEMVIERVSDRGAVNRAKNPLLTIWTDLNVSALAYWRDLGLTPAGLKRIDEKAMKPSKKQNALEKALKDIG